MKVYPTKISGCFIIEPTVFEDNRGVFFESFNMAILEKQLGVSMNFVQDNHSLSRKGVLRGLHFQVGTQAQAKLIRVAQGKVLDVAVDLRKNSKTYGQHLLMHLSAENRRMLYIPRGMAHGFVALEDDTLFLYKCDNYYNKEAERGIRFDDPDLRINWDFPTEQLIISEKDKQLLSLREWEG